MYSQATIKPGVYIDIYTLHTDTGGDKGSLTVRRDNVNQIAEYIDTYSSGSAVIVLGDTNFPYTGETGNLETALLDTSDLQDPWIELVRMR
ncbi:hypothetical protein SH601_05150 [Gracilibacillus sp. S3-1-1]|uniref:Uncharacterized protein n=1 Tax=Gracilibacillus pellucidus TaxID=3095368 RepID=A0ACC6M338_9BACI|nr:hypothetical protein [Gracilibacillus sp. S3-1-1]MDX8045371.1 hypothetical protein [Gracilibacillus sp. S3-1-1]